MNDKPDLASEFMRILDEEARKLLGEKKARELRENINERLEDKRIEPIKW